MTTKADVLAARDVYERTAKSYLAQRGWREKSGGLERFMFLRWFVGPSGSGALLDQALLEQFHFEEPDA
jgi:hypothetical protein